MVPTSDDDRVNGVIELGFLRPLSERDIELFELIADNIGMSIEAARYRQRLQEVLAETHRFSDQIGRARTQIAINTWGDSVWARGAAALALSAVTDEMAASLRGETQAG